MPLGLASIGISVVTPMHDEEACVQEFLRRTDAVLAAVYAVEDSMKPGVPWLDMQTLAYR